MPPLITITVMPSAATATTHICRETVRRFCSVRKVSPPLSQSAIAKSATIKSSATKGPKAVVSNANEPRRENIISPASAAP